MKSSVAVVLSLAVVLGSCATTAPYKDALRRVGDFGPRIAGDIEPKDAGGEARKAEFLKLCDECRALGDER